MCLPTDADMLCSLSSTSAAAPALQPPLCSPSQLGTGRHAPLPLGHGLDLQALLQIKAMSAAAPVLHTLAVLRLSCLRSA